MAQLVTRVDDALVAEVDELVARGDVSSRSDAVRAGLRYLVDSRRRAAVGEAIAEGYQRIPQTDDEIEGLDRLSVAMINEEPW